MKGIGVNSSGRRARIIFILRHRFSALQAPHLSKPCAILYRQPMLAVCLGIQPFSAFYTPPVFPCKNRLFPVLRRLPLEEVGKSVGLIHDIPTVKELFDRIMAKP